MSELTIVRTLTAPPERVWRAWTTAEELGAWIWPTSWGTTCSIDLRVGGRFRIESAGDGPNVSGEYVTIDPPGRIVTTWQWDDEVEETLVTITIEPDGTGSTLTVTHERFTDEETRADHLQGWNDCLDRLPAHLTPVE
jgi:uncharacterized protein YndB with AHSA1/START domain